MKTFGKILSILLLIAAIGCEKNNSENIKQNLNGIWIADDDSIIGATSLVFNHQTPDICYLHTSHLISGEMITISLPYRLSYDYPNLSLLPKSVELDVQTELIADISWLRNKTLLGNISTNNIDKKDAQIEFMQLDKLLEENEQWKADEVDRIDRLADQGVISEEQADARKKAIEEQAAVREEEIEKKRIEIKNKLTYHYVLTLRTDGLTPTIIGQFWH